MEYILTLGCGRGDGRERWAESGTIKRSFLNGWRLRTKKGLKEVT